MHNGRVAGFTHRIWIVILVGLAIVAAGCTEDSTDGDDAVDDAAEESIDQPDPAPTSPEVDSASLIISYADADEWLQVLPESEQLDQIRDWAQYGLASTLDMSVDEAAGFFFDRPGVRDTSLADASNAPVGSGRYVPADDTFHVLVDANDPYRDRTVALALDDYLTDSSVWPDNTIVYSYSIDRSSHEIALELTDEAPTLDLAEKLGLLVKQLETSVDIESFLQDVQHLSEVWIDDDGRVWAAGWNWGDVPYGAVDLTDLAVLQRAYSAGAADTGPGFSLDPLDDERQQYDVLSQLVANELIVDFATYVRLLILGVPEAEVLGYANEDWDLGSEDPLGVMGDIYDVVNLGLDSEGEGLQAAADLLEIQPDRMIFYALSKYMDGHSVASIARYDGGIDGTGVGMTLFYTDLIAKDWASGVGSGVPSENGIDDFVDKVKLGTNWSYCPQDSESGRLWLGLDSSASVVHDNSILFGSTVTRLFSRSDVEYGQPGAAEIEPSYHFGAPLRWWDQHYQEIADYEPQYHRLDQIMRWSTAIAWLADLGRALPVVEFEPATQDLEFDGWFASTPGLKETSAPTLVELGYQHNEIVVPEPSALTSRCGDTFIFGGVTLSSRRAVGALRSVADDVPLAFRRAGQLADDTNFENGLLARGVVDDFAEIIEPVSHRVVRTSTGTKVEIQAFGRNVNTLGRVNLQGLNGRTRTMAFDQTFEPGRISSSVSSSDVPIGRLTAESTSSGARITWSGSPLDFFRRIVNRMQEYLSTTRSAGGALRAFDDIGDVRLVVEDGRATYVNSTIDNSWIRFADDLIDDGDPHIARLGVPGDEVDQMTAIYAQQTGARPDIAPQIVSYSERTGRRIVSLRRLDEASPPATLPLAQALDDGRPVFAQLTDDGRIPIEGLDPNIRVRVSQLDVSDRSPSDIIQLSDGRVFVAATSTAVQASSVLLVEECPDCEN